MSDLLHTIPSACAKLACGKTRCYELIAAGHLDARKLGRSTRITDKSLRAYVASLPVAKIRMSRYVARDAAR